MSKHSLHNTASVHFTHSYVAQPQVHSPPRIRLAKAGEYRDEVTGNHVVRMAKYSREIGEALGLSDKECDEIEYAAPMHDIGKIGIPDSILRKPGKLTEEEYDVMKGHPKLGMQMLSGSSIKMVKMASDIAGYHHERFDGTGYPTGLKGHDIPLSARICAIVDVYDALVHERVYKDAIFEDEAIKMMREQSGKQFDPELFELFVLHLDTMRSIRMEVKD